jgi:transposase
MFIRKKINKGGACCVMLMTGERVKGKKHVVSRIVKYFGSTKDPDKLQELTNEANEYKKHLETVSPKAKTLKITSELDIKSCASQNIGFNDIYGTVFEKVFSKLDLKSNLLKQLRDLVVMRIASPASKLKTTKIAGEYGIDCKVDSIYKMMDQITNPAIEKIKKTIYDNTVTLLAEEKRIVDVLFYDLTTVYFENSNQNELCNFGFSKDGKHTHVQIMLAVIVTTDGLLIDYKEFPGNCYEGHTLIPVLHEIKERYSIDKVVLVADAALMNKINLDELDKQNIKYIISARIKNSKNKEEILNITDYKTISKCTNDDGYFEEIKSKTIALEKDFLIAYHSTKRANKDEKDREKSLEKIKKYVQSTAKSKLTGALRKSYVKVSKDCKIQIDEEKLSQEKRFDGFFGLRTNIKDINPIEFLSSYRGLWQVEQTFRIAKNSLEIRPVFHYTPKRIRAHFAICYMALALVRHVGFILKTKNNHIPAEEFHLLLDKIRVTQIVDSQNNLFEILENQPSELSSIYQSLNIKPPKRFSCKSSL